MKKLCGLFASLALAISGASCANEPKETAQTAAPAAALTTQAEVKPL